MLQLILGSMFSGKTSHAIRLCRRYRAIGRKVLFVNHTLDTRYSTCGVVSHDNSFEQCVFANDLDTLETNQEFIDADVVIIEEAQFFVGLYAFIKTQVNTSLKDYVVVGLSGDFQMNPIGEILSIIPLADKIEHLTGLCYRCKDGTLGPFTKRTTLDTSLIVIGEKDAYECVCRKHFQ